MSVTRYINNSNLLAATSVDEFSLHLPDPKTLINNIIENDDWQIYTQLVLELYQHLYKMGINMGYNKENANSLCNLLIKKQAYNIINVNLLKLEYTKGYAKYIKDTLSNDLSSNFCKSIKKYKDNISIEQQSIIRYLTNNINLSHLPITKYIIFKVKELKEKYIKEFDIDSNSDLLLDLLFINKLYIAEYIKWIIEISYYLNIQCTRHSYNDLRINVFWLFLNKYGKVNEYKFNLTISLIPYFEKYKCNPGVPIHLRQRLSDNPNDILMHKLGNANSYGEIKYSNKILNNLKNIIEEYKTMK